MRPALASLVMATAVATVNADEQRQRDVDALMAAATEYYLRYYGDPVLTRVAEPVHDVAQLHPAIVPTMKRVLDTWHYPGQRGVGIAAPQIGASVRLIIVPVEGVRTLMVNPRLVGRSDEQLLDTEMCMSIPGFRNQARRHAWVDVEYETEDGEAKMHRIGADTVELPSVVAREGDKELIAAAYNAAKRAQYEARCLQHELDHLDGRTIVGLLRNKRREAERCVLKALSRDLVR